MKIVRRIVLIAMIMLLIIGIRQFGSQMRFAFDLLTGRYGDAELIYGPTLVLDDSDQWAKVDEKINTYMDRKMDRYYKGKLSYEDIVSFLTDINNYQLFHPYALKRMQLVREMEDARAALAQADEAYESGDYFRAIPLFHQALIADETAVLRLEQAETAVKNETLVAAETAMEKGQYDTAQNVLITGISVLGEDDDLIDALEDVRFLKADQAYRLLEDASRRLLLTNGPVSAFRYVDDILEKTPDSFELQFLSQQIRHEYEEDVCSRAKSLWEADDLIGACRMLEDGLSLIDSEKIKTLYDEIRVLIPYWLGEMPLARDDTADTKTGAESTVMRDQVVKDIFSNTYEHSFCSDIGSISIALSGKYSAFSGTVAFPAGEKADIYRTSATLQVFGDNKLIAEFKGIDASSAPIPFLIPVEGVQELRLSWICDGANGWKDWGRFATIFDGRFLPAAAGISSEN